MALKGIKVVELLGLAPGPFCGMYLAEFGASVTVIDKIQPAFQNVLGNGKKNIALNLKHPTGKKIFKDLCRVSDVLIEPFRPGVMEGLGLGPNELLLENHKLIYARLTGYGQYGCLSKMGGHDINFVSLSGLLSILGEKNNNPLPPLNYAADFAGGGLICALGIIMALYERTLSNKGQVIDANMVEGTSYISSWLYRSQQLPIWGKERGENILDGGVPFYNTYKTKDRKFITVGALEPKFYENLISTLNISLDTDSQFDNLEDQKEILTKVFLARTQKEWIDIFDGVDACVTPVLTLKDAPNHPHNKSRESFIKSYNGEIVPKPAPILERTPGVSLAHKPPSNHGENTNEILLELDYTQEQIKMFDEDGIIYILKKSNL